MQVKSSYKSGRKPYQWHLPLCHTAYQSECLHVCVCVCDCVTSFWLARVNYLTIHTVISYESVSLAIDFVLWISPKCIAAFCSLNRFPLIALRQWYMAVFIEVMSALPSSLFTNIRSPRSHGLLRQQSISQSKLHQRNLPKISRRHSDTKIKSIQHFCARTLYQ